MSAKASSSNVRLASASYGKDLVRIFRIVRDASDPSSHRVAEYTVRCLLHGESLTPSYTKADNSPVVATDTVKNTLNYLAKVLPADDVLCPERYALHVVNHFLSTYSHIEKTEVDLIQHKWTRIVLDSKDGGAHKHSFVRDGEEKRTVRALGERSGSEINVTTLEGGIKGLLVLKSSGSAFHGFHRDSFTTLKEVHDRIFSTEVECSYSIALPKGGLTAALKKPATLPKFCEIHSSVKSHILRIFALDDSASVQATMYRMGEHILGDAANTTVQDVSFALPNKHYIPIDLGFKGLSNLDEKNAEVFLPTAHPSGYIKAKIARSPAAKL
ncbi:probable urate oxidase (uricase) [Sporisorium reilianum SRZ2]|uniref:Uricase n=1 Tax=Sporisorium reilianum (strain SRZ2) TaxID=999809 RepID=E6ZL90_SPORE|nr:probable urate oxidase (uricase) [Sporisorium reilianum SRZ2]